MEAKVVSPTFNDTHSTFSVRHLQTAFCHLMLGYVLVVVCL